MGGRKWPRCWSSTEDLASIPCAGGRRSGGRRRNRTGRFGLERIVEIDALLYLPVIPRSAGRAASTLSAGWRRSFEALLTQEKGGATTGNAGLTAASGRPRRGVDSARFASHARCASRNVTSLLLEPRTDSVSPQPPRSVCRAAAGADNCACADAAVLSGEPGAAYYRVSIKGSRWRGRAYVDVVALATS